jgi:hypothetical protein
MRWRALLSRRLFSYARLSFYSQILALLAISYWSIEVPSPGYAIGALAVAAAIMGVRAVYGEKFSKAEQAIWIVAVIILGSLEFRALNKDQNERKEQEAAIRWQDDFNRKQERRQFTALLNAGRTLLTEERHSASEMMNQLTGGKSFVVLNVLANQGYHVPVLSEFGRYPIHGLFVQLVDMNDPNLKSATPNDNVINVGSIVPKQGRSLPSVQISDANFAKLDLNAYFSADNGFWNEEMHIRKVGEKFVTAIAVRTWAGKPLRICVDKDYPRDFKRPKDWEDKNHSLCPPAVASSSNGPGTDR